MTTGNIILLVVLGLLLVASPILMTRRNKREQERQKQLIDSLKIGDFVLTYSGIFGKITEIVEKETGKFVVLETGEKTKNFITVSENAIYTVTNNNAKVYDANGQAKPAAEAATAPEVAEEQPTKKSKQPKTAE